jgi:hypothetical protein
MKTEKELLEIANKIAKETIFVGAEATGIKWKGYHVFDPILKESPNGEIPCIGLPQFILLDDEGKEYNKGNLTYEETFEIMDLFPDYATDDED